MEIFAFCNEAKRVVAYCCKADGLERSVGGEGVGCALSGLVGKLSCHCVCQGCKGGIGLVGGEN